MHSALSRTRLASAATLGAVGSLLLDNHNRNNNVSLPQADD